MITFPFHKSFTCKKCDVIADVKNTMCIYFDFRNENNTCFVSTKYQCFSRQKNVHQNIWSETQDSESYLKNDQTETAPIKQTKHFILE